MISVRAETPSISLYKVENVEINVLQTLEISFFPGVSSYDLQLKVSRHLTDMLHKYFSLESAAAEYEQYLLVQQQQQELKTQQGKFMPSDSDANFDNENFAESMNSSDSNAVNNVNSFDNSLLALTVGESNNHKDTKKTFSDRLGELRRSIFKSTKSSETIDGRDNINIINNSQTPQKTTRRGSIDYNQVNNTLDSINTPQNQVLTTSSSLTTSPSSTSRQECIYINYMRVGELNVDVSTTGFPIINVENYHAVVEPFFCRGEVLDWNRLIIKYAYYAFVSVTKNYATNKLNSIGNMLMFRKNQMSGNLNGYRIENAESRNSGTFSGGNNTMRSVLTNNRLYTEQSTASKYNMLLGVRQPHTGSRVTTITHSVERKRNKSKTISNMWKHEYSNINVTDSNVITRYNASDRVTLTTPENTSKRVDALLTEEKRNLLLGKQKR